MTTRNRLAETTVAPKRSPQQICNDANERMLADPEGRRDVHWYVFEGRATIGWLRQLGTVGHSSGHIMERDRSQFTAADWWHLSDYLEKQGSRVRYQSDGTRYEIEAGQAAGTHEGA
jgi:hypothetical protein